MNGGQLQEWLDRLSITSWQRWTLIALTVASAATASSICAVVEGRQATGVLVLIVIAALASAVRSDSHTALIAEVLIVWQWLVSADDVTTAWSIALAACLALFHCSVAIMAVTPISAVVGAPLLLMWARRASFMVGAAVVVWFLVVLLDQGAAVGRPALTAAGLAVLAALALLAARRSLSGTDQVEPR